MFLYFVYYALSRFGFKIILLVFGKLLSTQWPKHTQTKAPLHEKRHCTQCQGLFTGGCTASPGRIGPAVSDSETYAHCGTEQTCYNAHRLILCHQSARGLIGRLTTAAEEKADPARNRTLYPTTAEPANERTKPLVQGHFSVVHISLFFPSLSSIQAHQAYMNHTLRTLTCELKG